ncbi:transglutaminaseTgpA domain-containing protein [Actinomadura sp. PM05-2]|uniref:TransglutaminaseTgpA domain-containing protein n=1 Tax=Actinomadura parmotrematis TaxID=2864039 RepID=A0ABS7FKW4_9ACTN|nr:transglutaminaseTgpA domain-containing protein [Actinomadura parmotrematis]
MTIMAGLATLAGSAGLYPLFGGRSWFWAGAGAVVMVALGGVLARRLRLPAALGAACGLAALLLYLTVAFTRDEALLWIVPTPASLARLTDLIGAGWDAANRYAAPVPLAPGIKVLSTIGIGLVAVIVDVLAVRLRRAAPAGLPLLALYSVPAAVRQDSVHWAIFGIGATGYLALLMADARDRVGGWGRLVRTPRWSEDEPLVPGGPGLGGGDGRAEEHGERPDGAALAATGRRIGAGAIAVAVLVPLAVPGIHPRGALGLHGARGGSQTVTTPDPLVSLRRELTKTDGAVVLTYTTDDPSPDYLRLYALDRFDDDRWTFTRMQSSDRDRITGRDLPPAPGLGGVATRRADSRIAVRSEVADMRFLPLPYAPASISIKGDWRLDPESMMVYSLKGTAAGRTYGVRSVRAEPSVAALETGGAYPTDIVTRYTGYPRNVPARIRELAEDVTAGARTAYAQAVALQRWFTVTGGFHYDLTATSPRRGDDLADFLLVSKRGYCEQFAASMALMARILGIPARVGLGFTAGTESSPGHYTVRSRDSHAWPELYFVGTGWVRFEPTPSGAAGQGTASTPSYSLPDAAGGASGGADGALPSASPSAAGQPSAAATEGADRHRNDEGEQAAPDQGDRNSGHPAAWPAVLVLLALLLLAPMVARAVIRRRRWAATAPPEPPRPSGGPWKRPAEEPPARRPGGPGGAAHVAWREMRADALDHGLPWQPSDTPRATAIRLAEELDMDAGSAAALRRIARAEEEARYSATAAPPSPERLRADVRTVRAAFAAGVTRRARWRARVLPPSTVDSATAAARGASERLLAALTRVTAKADKLNQAVLHRTRRRPRP